ncbi:unnamed protein product [Caenorhabditis auriculariae]|uniref:Uncharacterized protein n=1 Tax=Caenorhabditis auriculariae TaxID=2777116 RepID=A0A8S1GY81_9PELO|nr:unnamed protein product [Caenorhabditis auriculariae]
MGVMQTPPPPTTTAVQKRKALGIDSLLEAKRSCGMIALKKELAGLIERKKEFLMAQRRASLLVDERMTDERTVMNEFAEFYRKVSSAPMAVEDHKEQMNLINHTIKESVVIEWPRQVTGLSGKASDDVVEVDLAPLIHRARNVVKCRTSHPTMRVKVYAISKEDGAIGTQPRTMEAFFRASLVKLASDGADSRCCQVAGKMILTQREGTAATKLLDQSGATVNCDGKLVASQSSPDASALVLLEQLHEKAAKTTTLKYENGFLCATFPEMGVTLNSMVDRRQLATRYAIQVEVGINVDNKLIVNHLVVSHPFLIAITNDQTEPLLHSIFWHRLVHADHNEPTDSSVDHTPIPWGLLRKALRSFVKSQLVQARFLSFHELCHIQGMILLPRIVQCRTTEQVSALETSLFGNLSQPAECDENPSRHLRNRLLSEEVLPTTLIERKEFMTDKCYSILDMATELGHSVWFWLFRATEMIQDVGHRLSPSPNAGDKKSTKTKKQLAASDDYQTMLSLFNKQILTFCSIRDVQKAFEKCDSKGDSIAVRFCDENAGYFSFVYGVERGKPVMGSISSDQVKDFKQGLPEVLFDESFPSRYSQMIRFEASSPDEKCFAPSLLLKRNVFHNYVTQRSKPNSVPILDEESVRVDALSGVQLARASPPPPQATGLPSSVFTSVAQNIDWSLFSESMGNLGFNQGVLPLMGSNNMDFASLLKLITHEPSEEQNDVDLPSTSEETVSPALDSGLQKALTSSAPRRAAVEEEEDEDGDTPTTMSIAEMLLRQYHEEHGGSPSS